jgi:hypothetical protein
MLHFATLACDYRAASYFADATERRVRFVLNGLVKDVAFLRQSSTDPSYVEGIYRQAKMGPTDFHDATLPNLLSLVAIMDTWIRKLTKDMGLELGNLPTAGAPWHFRGDRAFSFHSFAESGCIAARSHTQRSVFVSN